MSRQRTREGRHVSVGGRAAEEVLESLVKQFSDPYTFIRELLQNSLDAGSARIEVRLTYAAEARELHVEVQDDGDGMDRPIIEGYLLTLFRSTKEDDLTKIGKFGIGFTSIFAMEPAAVVVDTGRDGVWHRVTFDAAREYTLSRLTDPYEGTTVTLRIPASHVRASEAAEKIRDAALRWCRYADATITVEARGTRPEWAPLVIRAPFTVDAPVSVRVERDGFAAVLGPHPAPAPPIGFYNRGITLWEAEEALVPGVCFRVAGRHLEHTLTRDNVIRDRHFDTVVSTLREVAAGALGEAVHAALEAAGGAGDLARAAAICGALAPESPWSWDPERRVLPGVRGPLSLTAIRPRLGLLGRLRGEQPPVWFAEPDCPVGGALAQAGHSVIAGRADDAHVTWAARTVGGLPTAVTRSWALAAAVDAPALSALLHAAGVLLGAELRPANLHGITGIAAALPAAGVATPLPLAGARRGAPLFVQHDHPVIRALIAHPVAAGAGILAVAVGAAVGLPPDRGAAEAPGRAPKQSAPLPEGSS